MNLYKLTKDAEEDMRAIWSFIAYDSVAVANRVEDAILENCELIAKSPSIGHSKPTRTKRPVLVWAAMPYKNYLIVYDPNTKPIQIVRVIQAARRKIWRSI